jgi:Toprim-like
VDEALAQSSRDHDAPENADNAENRTLDPNEGDSRYSPAPSGNVAKRYHLLKGSRRSVYPGSKAIDVGRPLVIVEGEFDALLLGQELAGIASVVTFGSAGDSPTARTLSAMLAAPSWYLSSDTDSAGDQAAARWLDRSERCIRVAPPAKDWTDAHQAGLDLQAFWHPILTGKKTSGAPANDRLELASETWQTSMSAWPEVWRNAWEERAAIMCVEAKLPRAVAEQKAYEDIREMMKLVGSEGEPID